MPCFEICPKCGEEKPMTEHHIVPKWVIGGVDGPTFRLCRECHCELEKIIRPAERAYMFAHRQMYWDILETFIGRKVQDEAAPCPVVSCGLKVPGKMDV